MRLEIKKWVLTPHAVEKVLERKISVKELTAVLMTPDEVIPQGPKYILSKKILGRKDNNIAAAILEKKREDLWVVITVMVNFQKK